MVRIDELKKRMTRFCAWRDRCTTEAEKKLRELGAGKDQISQVLAWLMQEGYLDDVRFARSYARGKFTNNQWGRIKIIAGLRSLGINQEMIDEALGQIDESDYYETLLRQAQKKWDAIKTAKDPFDRKQKTIAYLVGKGYETELALQVVDQLPQNHKEQ